MFLSISGRTQIRVSLFRILKTLSPRKRGECLGPVYIIYHKCDKKNQLLGKILFDKYYYIMLCYNKFLQKRGLACVIEGCA